MRRKMERLVLLPFSVGCISESSVAVGIQHNATSKPPPPSSEKDQDGEEGVIVGEILLEESLKNSQRFTALAKPNIGVGIHRLYKGFKNFSQFFVYKEEMEDMEMDMEIGSPTDVKHVTHIGCDATTRSDDDAINININNNNNNNNNPLIDWETLLASDLLSVPSSTSWRQFEDHLSNPTPHHLPNIVHHSI